MLSETAQIDTYTTPDDKDSVLARYLAEINAAQHTIDGMVYDLSHPQILAALKTARGRGVAVGGVGLVVDHVQTSHAKEQAAADALIEAGCDVTDGTDQLHQIVHDKTLVLDGTTVLTGSLNLTERGFLEENDAHVIVCPTLAQLYLAKTAALKAWILVNEPQDQLHPAA